MKKVLILVLSSDFPPYDKMIETSIKTWDSIEVEGVESVFFCGKSKHKKDTNKIIYLPVENGLYDMGYKTIGMFEWAEKNKEYDYIARVNASCYVDKKTLIKYIQNLPDTNLFSGAVTKSVHGFDYCWGGTQYIISKDVVKKIIENKLQWQHKYMEDESMSMLVNWLSIPFSECYSAAIDNMNFFYRLISYSKGESLEFTSFKDVKKLNHHFYRVKQDGNRGQDENIMNQLFKVL